MNGVDTNILIYEHDPRDPVKQSQADTLIKSLTDGALIWQVACEYLSASRKLEPFGYKPAEAWSDLQDMLQIWTPVLPTWKALHLSQQLQSSYSLSHWDALLIAACLEGGVTRLYSEDFDAYPMILGLQIINPFKTSIP